jgi:hypothetical protein
MSCRCWSSPLAISCAIRFYWRHFGSVIDPRDERSCHPSWGRRRLDAGIWRLLFCVVFVVSRVSTMSLQLCICLPLLFFFFNYNNMFVPKSLAFLMLACTFNSALPSPENWSGSLAEFSIGHWLSFWIASSLTSKRETLADNTFRPFS